jgi:hypothetical protein
MLGKGNLTPRERFLLLIQNDVNRIKTGKDSLTEADKAALENWQATTSGDSREWNRLNHGWKKIGRMDLEVEFHFNDAQSAHFQTKPFILELMRVPMYREMRRMIKGINSVKKVSGPQAMEIVEKQRAAKLADGIDFEYAVYRYAFELLSEEDRMRMIALYPDIETDHQYLDQEEIIANLLNDKEDLSEKAKKKLAELIAARSYNAFAKQYQLYHYFACIPLAEVARHFLMTHNVVVKGKLLAKNQEADDEDDSTHEDIRRATEQYAKDHETTVEAILKEGFINWYDTTGWAYTPLVVSDEKELFARWLASKAKARKELEKLIGAGKLAVRTRTPEESRKDKLYSKGLENGELQSARMELELLDFRGDGGELEEKKAFESFSNTVLTGESLYHFSGDFTFVKEFKERVDTYDPNLGLVYAEEDPEHKGDHLDRELLLCPLTSKGEPGFFSIFGMSLGRLEALMDSTTFLQEEEKEGKLRLSFSNKQIEQLFRKSGDTFIASYGKLLAMRNLLQKASLEYETDLTFRVNDLLATLDSYIEARNNALREAILPLRMGKRTDEDDIVEPISSIDESFFIDKDGIKPDDAVYEEHYAELKQILGNF